MTHYANDYFEALYPLAASDNKGAEIDDWYLLDA